MSKTGSIREAWHPQSGQDREMILLELEEVLKSSHFCNSKRYPALLKYIVEQTLAGNSDLLKERTLGVEVFDRPAAYDTNADTVVRYTAGEVRKRLSLYYHELDRQPEIQISLPAGSYVPEFFHSEHEVEGARSGGIQAHAPHHATSLMQEMEPFAPWNESGFPLHRSSEIDMPAAATFTRERAAARKRWWLGVAALLTVTALAAMGWRYRSVQPRSAMDNFWAPVVRDQVVVMICTGGSVFSQTHLSGVATAGKDIDYPFISMQSASAIAQLSALLQRSGGTTTQLQSAAATPLTELREHPVIFLGGYNNEWTLRLLQPLRFHFSPVEVSSSIVDQAHPGVRWERDPLLPYSSADDYALVARFRDATTGGWVVVLAGVGRNGTEAAAQFATSPHYMQLLRDQSGSDFSNRNVEAVLKVSVIDGKTGAPSILAMNVW